MTPWQVPRRDPAQEHQEFDSWRHQTHQPQQPGYNPLSSMASDPYLSSFYAGSYHYPGFGVGDGMSIIQSLITVGFSHLARVARAFSCQPMVSSCEIGMPMQLS